MPPPGKGPEADGTDTEAAGTAAASAGTDSAETERFLADVRSGLSARPKRIPCRWLYDAEGSRLFEAIMALPEYYPTRCETRILEIHKAGILDALRATDPGGVAAEAASGGTGGAGPDRAAGERRGRWHVVDLGAGNGAKTCILLRHFRGQGSLGCYLPVDVCPEPLQALAGSLERRLPGLPVRPLVGDWLEALDGLDGRFPGPKLALFLGSNIGNYDRRSAIRFLSGLRARLSPGDALLVGFDLRKEPSRVLRAYSDSAGVTARFNLNLLDRINRELGGTFRREDFFHRATYEEGPGAARSYLVARRALDVTLGMDGFRAAFEAGEAIHTESSYKYSPGEIGDMAREAGFLVAAGFTDPEEAFLDSLWRPDPKALRADPGSGPGGDWTAGGMRGS